MSVEAVLAFAEMGIEVAQVFIELQQNERHQQLQGLISSTAEKLSQTIHASASRVIEKIESDKLEELQARTKNLAFLIRTQKPDQIIHYSMTLNESVDYALNRIREEKLYWCGPWLAGKTAVAAALELAGAPQDTAELARNVQEVRYIAANAMVHEFVRHRVAIQWETVHQFLNGATHSLGVKWEVPAARSLPAGTVACPQCGKTWPKGSGYCFVCKTSLR